MHAQHTLCPLSVSSSMLFNIKVAQHKAGLALQLRRVLRAVACFVVPNGQGSCVLLLKILIYVWYVICG